MKKLMVLILCIGLLTTGLYGCGKQENVSETTGLASASTSADISENPETESTAGAWEEEPAEVTWYMWNVGGSFTEAGVQAVEDALNEITLKKINVKVDLVILEMGTYMTQMAMQVSAGDKIDLITTFPAGSGYYSTMVNTGQLLPLDSLIDDYAPELYDIIPEALLEATTFKGKLYAVPIYTDYVQSSCTVAKAAMFDETGMKPEDISSNENLTEVFKKLHELHPEIILLSSGSKTLVGRRGFDTMGTQAAAVYFGEGGDPTKVVKLFEHEAYKAEVAQIKRMVSGRLCG